MPDFGVYTTILTFLFFGGAITDAGILKVVVRNVSRDPRRARSLFWNSMVSNAALSVLAWVVIALIAFLFHYSPRIVILLMASCSIMMMNSVMRSADGLLRAYQRMEISSTIEIAMAIGFSGVGIALILKGFGLGALIVLHIVFSFLDMLLRYGVVRARFLKDSFQFDFHQSLSILRQAAPLAVLGSLGMLSKRLDIILLSWMKGVEAVGYYGAAVKITSVLWIPMQSAAQALLPYMSARLSVSVDALQSTYEKTVRLCILAAFPVAILVFSFSRQIVGLLFGPEYLRGRADVALMILVWAFFWDMISGPVNVVVINSERSLSQFIPYALGVTALNAVMNVLLIPRYGFIGASVSAVASAVVINVLKIWVVHQVFREKPGLHLMAIRPAVGSLAMILALLALKGANPFLSSMLALIVYGLVLAGLKEFGPEDRKLLVTGVRKVRQKLGLENS